MGEKQIKPFQLSFNGLLKVDFKGSHVTSDGGLIWVREVDERLTWSHRRGPARTSVCLAWSCPGKRMCDFNPGNRRLAGSRRSKKNRPLVIARSDVPSRRE